METNSKQKRHLNKTSDSAKIFVIQILWEADEGQYIRQFTVHKEWKHMGRE